MWLVFGLALVVGVGSHLWMLMNGLSADMVNAHAWSNIVVSAIVVIATGWGLYEVYN